MGMTVKRRKDTRTPRVFVHKIADIRGGVSVNTSELGGDYLAEGTVISAPDNGICHVVKAAKVVEAVLESGTVIKVSKNNNFQVGNYVMAKVGGLAYAITAIDRASSNDYDSITVGTTLGAIDKEAFIAEAAAESSTTTSALKYTPFAVVGTGKPVIEGDNLDTDAWVIGVTYGNSLPDFIASSLKGIINYD